MKVQAEPFEEVDLHSEARSEILSYVEGKALISIGQGRRIRFCPTRASFSVRLTVRYAVVRKARGGGARSAMGLALRPGAGTVLASFCAGVPGAAVQISLQGIELHFQVGLGENGERYF